MVAIFKYTKYLAKLTIILFLIIVILTYQDGPVKRRGIRHFQILNNVFRKRLPNVKYILIWSKEDSQLEILKKDHESFTDNKCTFNNCFVTSDRDIFDDDHRNFDAILMSAKIMYNASREMPAKRFPNQTFVFASSESADYYPVCDEKYDNYFNTTWTYKLNSDVPWPYFDVYDRQGKYVSPKTVVNWINDTKSVPTSVGKKIADMKKFAVAWFASNCHTNSKRENFVVLLKQALLQYGLVVDVVGKCGTRTCPIEKEKTCMDILKHYYFYLAFENSIIEDYVTEKVVRPMLHYTVPVVLGGAKYARQVYSTDRQVATAPYRFVSICQQFLPPHSYINAYKLGAKKTAAKMAGLLLNQTAYLEYFRWRNHYMIKHSTNSVCNLCKLLNMGTTTVHKNFRRWWNPKFKVPCKKRSKRSMKLRFKKQPKKDNKFKIGTSCSLDEAPYLKTFFRRDYEIIISDIKRAARLRI